MQIRLSEETKFRNVFVAPEIIISTSLLDSLLYGATVNMVCHVFLVLYFIAKSYIVCVCVFL